MQDHIFAELFVDHLSVSVTVIYEFGELFGDVLFAYFVMWY